MPRNNNNNTINNANKKRKNQNRKKTKHGKGSSESVTVASNQPSVDESKIIDVDAATNVNDVVVVADGDITEKADDNSANEQSSSEYIFVFLL